MDITDHIKKSREIIETHLPGKHEAICRWDRENRALEMAIEELEVIADEDEPSTFRPSVIAKSALKHMQAILEGRK